MGSKLLISFVLLLSFPLFSQVQLQFITTNAYGNNLYIDNLTLGTKFNTDVAVVGITNIIPDTSYTIGSAPFSVAPKVTIVNVGSLDISKSLSVTATVTPGVYSSTKSVDNLNVGQAYVVTFDDLTITPGQPINITVSANLSDDQNLSNNNFTQYSVYFPGVERKLLIEEFTSSTCAPCASNNPTIDAFITSRYDSLTAIKYHMNWPSPGNDPMYHYNVTQNTARRSYYGITSVPTVIMDGIVQPSYPYSSASSLPNAFYPRKSVGSPLTINIVNSWIGKDSIKSDISVQILSPLRNGNYYLRVAAIERHIKYATAPGSNGEKNFYDVFRKAYPNPTGTLIPTTVGTHLFSFTYQTDKAVWVDSMIYTSAFIQNDLTKEVINSGKSRNYAEILYVQNTGEPLQLKKDIAEDFVTNKGLTSIIGVPTENFSSSYHYDLFEGTYPPSGWRLSNPDGGITFASYTGANGSSIEGNKSIMMRFYDYTASNQKDTLTTRVYSGLFSSDTIKFDYAYAPYSNQYSDRLTVKMSTDSGRTFPLTIFDMAGTQLATTTSTTNAFVPTSPAQWRTFSYVLELTSAQNDEETGLPDYALEQNYPNPFNPSTNISFKLAEDSKVSLKIFNLLGEEIVSLVNGNLSGGTHKVALNASDFISGIYFYRIEAVGVKGGKFIETKKLIFLK